MLESMEVLLSIVAYSFCSGTMLLVNKLILHHLPYPSLTAVVEFIAAVLIIKGMEAGKLVDVDAIRWKFVKPYLLYIASFAFGIFCNMKSLATANVETVIVFRSLSPCVVAFLEALFLGREFPSSRSWAGLLIIVAGAYGYANHDEKFQTQGMQVYLWPALYTITISFEMTYGKALLKAVDLKTLSGPVLYSNVLGILPMLVLGAFNQEVGKFLDDASKPTPEHPVTLIASFWLFLGCVIGTGIGYASWWCRGKVSATSFTLIGVMNKCLTILLNLVMWDNHAGPAGIASLLLCLAGGFVYKQAPMRTDSKKEEELESLVPSTSRTSPSSSSDGSGTDDQA